MLFEISVHDDIYGYIGYGTLDLSSMVQRVATVVLAVPYCFYVSTELYRYTISYLLVIAILTQYVFNHSNLARSDVVVRQGEISSQE